MKLDRIGLAALAAAAGVLMAAAGFGEPVFWLLAGCAALTVAIILAVFRRWRTGVCLVIILGCAGGFRFSQARDDYLRQIAHNQTFAGREAIVTGVMTGRPEPTLFGYSCRIQARSSVPAGIVGTIRIFSRQKPADDWYGQTIRVAGRFRPLEPAGGPWPGFEERNQVAGYLTGRTRMRLTGGFALPAPFQWAEACRRSMMAAGRSALRGLNLDLLHGLLFGERFRESPARRKLIGELQRTGSVHLLSVSGLHVGLVAGFLNLILGWCGLPRRIRALPIAAAIGFYALLSGLEPPVLRAGLMLLFCFAVERAEPAARLFLAGLLLLLADPYNLFDLGFQLSFAATLGLVWLFPALRDAIPASNRWRRWVRDCLLFAVAAQLPLIPILVDHFQQIVWIGPLANLWLAFPTTVAVIGGMIGEGVGTLLPMVGRLILTPVDWAVSLIRESTGLLAGQWWAASWSPVWPWPWVAGYYLGLLLVFDWLRPSALTGKRPPFRAWGPLLLASLFLANLVVWAGYGYRLRNDCLLVSVIDVGQGDAILLRAPDGTSALVDTGGEGYGRRSVVPALRRFGVERLRWVLLSHGHRDHAGGLAEILDEVPVERLIFAAADDQLAAIQNQAARRRIKRQYAAAGMKLKLGAALGEVLAVQPPEAEEHSLVTAVSFGKNRVLLTGDLDGESEERLVKRLGPRLRATVLKVGHHGSNHGSSLRFLAQVRPAVAVVSAGKGNRYGHPGAETLNRIKALGIMLRRTDRHGRIDLRLYRNRITVTTTKKEKLNASRRFFKTRP
jgi:competence protein ComEC